MVAHCRHCVTRMCSSLRGKRGQEKRKKATYGFEAHDFPPTRLMHDFGYRELSTGPIVW